MTGNWNLEEARLKPLTAEYFALYSQVGAQRFERAVTAIIHEGGYHFFPTVGEFKSHVPASTERKPWCGKCNEGFLYIPDPEAYELYGDPDATKMMFCSCRYTR